MPVAAPPPEVAPAPLADPAVLGALLRDAYRLQGQGPVAGARAAFEHVAELARAHAANGSEPEDSGNPVPARGGHAAVQGARGVLFFRADTGEPVAFEPEAALEEGEDDVPPDAPLFILRLGEEQVLYDATTGAPLARSARIRVRPGGKVAYLFETSDCRWHAWDLAGRRETHALEARGGACEDRAPDEASFITPDGRWLIALGGRWDLRTGRLHRFPEGSAYGPSLSPAVSSDRRFVAYFRMRWPPALEGDQRVTLALFDLRSGAEAHANDPSFASLANGRALEFADAPLRLLVVDYTRWAYAVPSLRLIVRVPSARGASVAGSGLRPEQERALTGASPEPAPRALDPGPAARLRARACVLGGFPLPRAVCQDARAPAPRRGP